MKNTQQHLWHVPISQLKAQPPPKNEKKKKRKRRREPFRKKKECSLSQASASFWIILNRAKTLFDTRTATRPRNIQPAGPRCTITISISIQPYYPFEDSIAKSISFRRNDRRRMAYVDKQSARMTAIAAIPRLENKRQWRWEESAADWKSICSSSFSAPFDIGSSLMPVAFLSWLCSIIHIFFESRLLLGLRIVGDRSIPGKIGIHRC